jgi:hypothetical protein
MITAMTTMSSLTFSCSLMRKVRFLRTRGELAKYCRHTLSAWIAPPLGQLSGGLCLGSDSRAASDGRREYCSTLSTEII